MTPQPPPLPPYGSPERDNDQPAPPPLEVIVGAQRYTDPAARDRMSRGVCPECGRSPVEHSADTRFWLPRGPGCSLRPDGVVDRIEQYDADIEEAQP